MIQYHVQAFRDPLPIEDGFANPFVQVELVLYVKDGRVERVDEVSKSSLQMKRPGDAS